MTKRDFFILLIKAFGLYSIISISFSVLPNNMLYTIRYIDYIGIIWMLLSLITIFCLFFFLIKKANKVSDFLKLEKGFDDNQIDISGLKSKDIIKIAVLIIGGLLFINNIPPFLSNTLFAFKASVPQSFENSNLIKYNNLKDYLHWANSGINLIMGYLLIFNFKKISNYINKKVVD